MSMYNLMHGMNPLAGILLKMLEIDQEGSKYSSGRFRDIYLNEDGKKIILFTRNGGGNRERQSYKGGMDLMNFYSNNPEISKQKLQVLCANCNWIKKYDNKEYGRSNR